MRCKLEEKLEDFNSRVRSGSRTSPPPCRIGNFRAWWRFYVFGFAFDLVRTALREIKSGVFNGRSFAVLSHRFVEIAEHSGTTVSYTGFDRLSPLGGKPAVFVANHMSLVETMMLPCAIMASSPVTIVAKRQLSEYPFFGKVLKGINPILVERKNARKDLETVLEQGCEKIREGYSVLLFPQGKRTIDFNPAKFNSLGAKLARRAGVPLVPIACQTDFARIGRIIKDIGPVDVTKPIRFACGDPMPPETAQAEMQSNSIGFISGKLREWGLEVVEANRS